MKRILSLTLALLMTALLFGVVGPVRTAHAEGDEYLGLWTLTTAEYQGVTVPVSVMGMEMTLEFLPDGTAHATSKMEGEEDVTEMTWAVTGENALTLYNDGDETSIVYDPETDTLVLEIEGEGKLIFSRGAGETESEPAAEPAADITGEDLTPENILGKWQLIKMEYEGNVIPVAVLGMEVTMDFLPDGIILLASKMGEEAEEATMKYEFTGENALTIMAEEDGEPTQGTYDPATGALTLAAGDSGNMILERVANDQEAEAGAAKTTAEETVTEEVVEVAALVGDWELTKAKTMGIEMPASQINTSMALTLKEDGSAIMTTNGSPNRPLKWKLEGTEVVLGTGSGENFYEAFRLTFDGVALTLEMASVQMIFEKVA